jgi:hypothetical protein
MDIFQTDARDPPEQKGQSQHEPRANSQQKDKKPLARLRNFLGFAHKD